MPNLLQRYLLRQFFFAAFNTVLLFVFVLVAGNAVKDILPLLASGKIEWSFFFDTLFHLIPSMIAYSLPLGILTATLLVLGRLSSQNELIAMKASGLSLWRIIAPLLLMSAIGVIFTLIVNFHWGPHSIVYYRKALGNIIRQKPLSFIQARTFVKDFPGYLFYVEKKQNDTVENCWLWELDSRQTSGANLFLHSKRGILRYDAQKNAIILTLLKASGEKYSTRPDGSSDAQAIAFDSTDIALPLTAMLGGEYFYKKLGYMTLSELLNERKSVENGTPGTQNYKYKVTTNLEIQKNAVMSFATLSLVLIAIPLGIRLSRAETSANLVLAIALALSFYFIVMAISWLETSPQYRPDMLVWLPHVVFQGLAVILLRRALKH